MGEMWLCYSWTYRPLMSIVMTLVILTCVVWCSEPEDDFDIVGRVYTRGNHWAVGHLMGKKSIDSLPVTDSGRNNDYPVLRHYGEDNKLHPSKLLRTFLRAMVGQKNQRWTPLLLNPPKSRQRTQKERDKFNTEVTDLLLAALDVKDLASN